MKFDSLIRVNEYTLPKYRVLHGLVVNGGLILRCSLIAKRDSGDARYNAPARKLLAAEWKLLIHLLAVSRCSHPSDDSLQGGCNKQRQAGPLLIGNLDVLTENDQYGIARYIQYASQRVPPFVLTQYTQYMDEISKDVTNALHFNYNDSGTLTSQQGKHAGYL
uniref:Uncharacterized protein n=1 Tax=Ditylenchus dipsaci TaxID=166011 RepID=A0A915EV55_9BILA